jgi:ubiquinone/menaquinone biosynthesis C-methylase UbiE
LEFTHWLYYHAGAAAYDKVMSAATLGGWWRWQRAVLDGISADAHILELGCGTGRLLAQRLRVGSAVGVDVAMPMLRQAHRRLNGHGERVPVLVADAAHLPFPDGAYDAVISTGVLTAIAEPRPVLMEARRVVRPGGRMAFVELMPPRRRTLRGSVMMAALQAVRDRFHDIPELLAELGLEAEDREIGRAGTVHLVTARAL